MLISFLGLLFFLSTVFFGCGFLAAIVARNKGYRPWFWILSAGPFGLLLILLKPSLQSAKTPEERDRWEQRIDLAGGILSGFTLFGMIAIVSLVASVAVVSSATVVIPAPVISVNKHVDSKTAVELPAPTSDASQESVPQSPIPAGDDPR